LFLSTFEIFKIGIGPSSSHTMGPMVAASRFLAALRMADAAVLRDVGRLRVTLYGSLAFTGRGHATDRAIALGLSGYLPHTIDPDQAEFAQTRLQEMRTIVPSGLPAMAFDPDADIIFDYGPPLSGHPNGLIFEALGGEDSCLLCETYYSIGGGFVLSAKELEETSGRRGAQESAVSAAHPYAFRSATEMLAMGKASGLSIAAMKRANEQAEQGQRLDARLDEIWSAMDSCIERGLRKEGILPGGLKVRRRAHAIHQQLLSRTGSNLAQPHAVNDWISVYAMAVSEENAAGGRVVTSPTNGAAGVVPAVIRYYRDHCLHSTHEGIRDFLLTAAAVGGVIKHNASISGAEVGCQGEVGSASAMAAAGLCAALGGSNEQIENAAEIALEHHLGITCDPVGGLVQVPCIERNGLGAIKAVAAASLALYGDGRHFMPLDNCIEAMRQTGMDMASKYKETSTGGLAVNLPEC
jgi:L-serine dehydratase